MTYVGRCSECGLLVSVGGGDRCRRHGYSYAYDDHHGPCEGTGKPPAGPVTYLPPGRKIVQTLQKHTT